MQTTIWHQTKSNQQQWVFEQTKTQSEFGERVHAGQGHAGESTLGPFLLTIPHSTLTCMTLPFRLTG